MTPVQKTKKKSKKKDEGRDNVSRGWGQNIGEWGKQDEMEAKELWLYFPYLIKYIYVLVQLFLARIIAVLCGHHSYTMRNSQGFRAGPQMPGIAVHKTAQKRKPN